MTAAPVDLRFDCRLDKPFMAELLPGGSLSPLVAYASSRYPVDVHFRRDWMSGSQHAMLYVGLNRVLDVEYRQGRVRLNPLRALRSEFGFDDAWGSWAPMPRTWPVAWELFLDQAVPWASDGRGAMGAGIVPRAHPETFARWSVMQNFGVQFRNDALRKTAFTALAADLRAALNPNPISAVPNPLKLEASVLYVDRAGDLLVAEVQSRRASELPWAAAITILNVRVLALWLSQDPEAYKLLATAIRTRVALGLLPPATPLPAPGCRIVPVTQAQTGISPRLRENIRLVWTRLAERDISEASDLRLLEWSLSGREVMTLGSQGPPSPDLS